MPAHLGHQAGGPWIGRGQKPEENEGGLFFEEKGFLGERKDVDVKGTLLQSLLQLINSF